MYAIRVKGQGWVRRVALLNGKPVVTDQYSFTRFLDGASRWLSLAGAESAALLVATQQPHLIGHLVIRKIKCLEIERVVLTNAGEVKANPKAQRHFAIETVGHYTT